MREQKKAINFKEMRYAVPCILVPFLTGLNFIVAYDSAKKAKVETQIAQKEKREINSDLQEPDLEKTQTMNKFQAVFDAYEHKEEFSAIKGIETEEDKNLELDNKDLYSVNEMDKINKLNVQGDLTVPKMRDVSNFDLYKGSSASNSPKSYSTYATYSPKYTEQSRDFENYVNSVILESK